MKETKIPIQNLYLMLAYSWELLPKSNELKLGSLKFQNSSTFFAEVLNQLLPLLKRRGLTLGYSETVQEGRYLRGKIDFGPSIKRMLLDVGRVSCTFDSLSEDSLPNQILKWACKRLVSSREVEKSARVKLADHEALFDRVSDLDVDKRTFRSISLNAGNVHYRFALNFCELLYDVSVPTDDSGDFSVLNFLREEKAMARVFEGFVRNFYRAEQSYFASVKAETMEWDACGDKAAISYLPQMRTDISLSNDSAVKIVDTKFYSKVFDERFGAQKIKSGNLYQLISYLRARSKRDDKQVSGILLYPDVGVQVDLSYKIEGFPVTVATVDLAADWDSVRARLIEILVRSYPAENVA
jgi:5-methylcytosine-specific restriction enzyme subunit McrC